MNSLKKTRKDGGKVLIKRLTYILSVFIQGIFIIETVINVIYCSIFESAEIWPLTIAHVFIPYLKYYYMNNIIDIFVLILFLCLSIILYVFSTIELLNNSNTKAPFIILNYLWNIIGFWTFGIKINNTYVLDIFSMMYYLYIVLSIVIVIPIKWKQQNQVIKAQLYSNRENPLLKKIDFLPKDYSQIIRTAKGPVIVEICIFFILLFFKYMGEYKQDIINAIYFFTVIFALIIFFGTISDYNFFVNSCKKNIGNCTIKKINILQIVSLILFILTYFIFKFY